MKHLTFLPMLMVACSGAPFELALDQPTETPDSGNIPPETSYNNGYISTGTPMVDSGFVIYNNEAGVTTPVSVDAGSEATTTVDPMVDAGSEATTTVVPYFPPSPVVPPVVDAGTCLNDLSSVGTGNFSITFTITTIQDGHVELLNQRSGCAGSHLWDLHGNFGLLNASDVDAGYNTLDFETDDTVNYSGAIFPVVINNGVSHTVVIKRLDGDIDFSVDNSPISKAGYSAVNLSALPPLTIGTSGCVGVDGTIASTGHITNVCLKAL